MNEAIEKPGKINMDLVNAQQARRVLDRLVGYEISEVLWKKVRKGLSAGRVQSVATRIICDREREIEAFEPEEYWLVTAKLAENGGKRAFEARYYGENGKKRDLRTEALYDLILCCIVGGMSPLYRRLYDEGLVNPGFGGEVLRVDGCCCILFTGESDVPDTVRQLLLDEIARVRAAGVDREVFTLCKNEKYGQLIENLENVEDSASQMADFALSGQTVAQQISMLAGLTAEDADAALQHILCTDRMATMYILPDGTAQAAEEDEEEEE